MTDRVSVAVIDSGVHVPHAHLPSVAGGVSIDLQGTQHATTIRTNSAAVWANRHPLPSATLSLLAH